MKVEAFLYRSAVVTDIFLTLDRPDMRLVEQTLAAQAGVQGFQNHIVYRVEQEFLGVSRVTYLWFTDRSVHFGHSIEEHS